MEASLAVQIKIVAYLKAAAAVLALVPAENIFDRSSRPERFPCIVIGEGQTVGEDIPCFDASEVYLTLHIWAEDQSFDTVKMIAGAVRRAVRRLEGEVDNFLFDELSFEDTRFVRDPGGQHTHAAMTVRAYVQDAPDAP